MTMPPNTLAVVPEYALKEDSIAVADVPAAADALDPLPLKKCLE
jgi:hypothetical protein